MTIGMAVHPIYTKIGYISGPMSGHPEFNFPAFTVVAEALRELGYTVVSPHEVGDGPTWQACMRKDIVALMACDYIILIPGWASSKGAMLELQNAVLLGMPVYAWDEGKLELQSKWPVEW